MRFVAIALAVFCLFAFTGCSTMTKPTPPPPSTPASKLLQAKTATLAAARKTEYLLYLPAGYKSDSSKPWPLILFLHGAGERGTNVWRAAIHGPSNYIPKHPDFPFILVAPLCPARERWSSQTLNALLDEVIKKYHADPSRIYLTGLSMGGYGAWDLGTSYPERFAAIAPICGGGETIQFILAGRQYDNRIADLKSLPVWAFHGAKDTTVPIAESERMIKALKDAGCEDVQFTVYPEAQHNSWTQTYDNPKLYEWFLQHQRAPVK